MQKAGDRAVLLCAAPGIPVLGPSGASAHLRGIAGALKPVAVVAAKASDSRGIHGKVDVPVVEAEAFQWPRWLKLPKELQELEAARACARKVVELKPTLVWERYSLFSDAGMKLHHAGVPWLLEVNAPLVLERQQYEALKGWKLRWAKSWERDVLQSAPVLVAVSRWLCQWLKEEVGCKGKILHLPNGVEPVAGEREKTRQRLGLEGRFVVGFLGSMKPWHGVLRLPDLLDRIPEAVGLCVGEGPVQIEHPRLIKTGQVSEAEAASLVAAMDVGLAPYGKEAPPWFCPLKILAYRAQGTPVVASDTGDCRELVGEAGSIVAVDAEISEWAEAVLSWKNRRCLLRVRSWEQVVAEAMAAL